MPATLTRFIFFPSGDLHAIVNADLDSELQPHTGSVGCLFVDVQRQAYLTCAGLRDQLALALPAVLQKDPQIGALVTAKIQAIDAAASVLNVNAPDILP